MLHGPYCLRLWREHHRRRDRQGAVGPVPARDALGMHPSNGSAIRGTYGTPESATRRQLAPDAVIRGQGPVRGAVFRRFWSKVSLCCVPLPKLLMPE